MAKDKLIQIASRIDEEEKQAIVKYCDENDITVSQLIRKAIKEYLENHKND